MKLQTTVIVLEAASAQVDFSSGRSTLKASREGYSDCDLFQGSPLSVGVRERLEQESQADDRERTVDVFGKCCGG